MIFKPIFCKAAPDTSYHQYLTCIDYTITLHNPIYSRTNRDPLPDHSTRSILHQLIKHKLTWISNALDNSPDLAFVCIYCRNMETVLKPFLVSFCVPIMQYKGTCSVFFFQSLKFFVKSVSSENSPTSLKKMHHLYTDTILVHTVCLELFSCCHCHGYCTAAVS